MKNITYCLRQLFFLIELGRAAALRENGGLVVAGPNSKKKKKCFALS